MKLFVCAQILIKSSSESSPGTRRLISFDMLYDSNSLLKDLKEALLSELPKEFSSSIDKDYYKTIKDLGEIRDGEDAETKYDDDDMKLTKIIHNNSGNRRDSKFAMGVSFWRTDPGPMIFIENNVPELMPTINHSRSPK